MMRYNTKFSIIVAGSTESGKSTFFNSLVDKEIIPLTSSSEIKLYILNLEYDNIIHNITLIDTPGFGNSLDDMPLIDYIENYIKEQLDSVIEEETRIKRNPKYKDKRVHCLLYFIPCTSNGLKQRDIIFLKRVTNLVNIIPVISKSDGLTDTELTQMKSLIKRQLSHYKIPVFDFENEEVVPEQFLDLRLNTKIPFACVFPDKLEEEIRIRDHPLGAIEIDNPTDNDFTILKDTLLNTHTHSLIEVTVNEIYENYRSEMLEKILQE